MERIRQSRPLEHHPEDKSVVRIVLGNQYCSRRHSRSNSATPPKNSQCRLASDLSGAQGGSDSGTGEQNLEKNGRRPMEKDTKIAEDAEKPCADIKSVSEGMNSLCARAEGWQRRL